MERLLAKRYDGKQKTVSSEVLYVILPVTHVTVSNNELEDDEVENKKMVKLTMT